jgi:PAS domain S-box-containing protein
MMINQVTIITDLAMAVHGADSLPAMMQTALGRVQQIANAGPGAVYLRDEAGIFTLGVCQGYSEEPPATLGAEATSTGLVGEAVGHRRAVAGELPMDDPWIAGAPSKPHTSVIIPLIGRNGVLGLMHLDVERSVEAVNELLPLLSAAGVQVGLAIDNTRRQSTADGQRSSASPVTGSAAQTMATSDHLPLILDSTLDIILIVDPAAMITYANRRLGELTNLKPEEVVNRTVFQFIPEEEHRRVQHHWQMVQAGRAQQFETPFQRAGGSYATCLIAASKILGAESYLFVIRDLTDEKNMQAQLIQASKSAALGQLVAGAAHGLNNPLTAVLGFAQILREEAEDETVQEDLDRIIRGAMRARNIVQDLMAFARQQSPIRTDTDINETVNKALAEIESRVLQNHVTLVVNLDKSLPKLWANPQQLKLVWENILINACQAMTPQGGGKLYVSSERIGDFVRVTFSDTGPGIPMVNMSRIFDPFFTTKGVGEGAGLGLSLCQGTVEAHGGQIWVESSEGEGATFIIELPISGKDQLLIDPTSSWPVLPDAQERLGAGRVRSEPNDLR